MNIVNSAQLRNEFFLKLKTVLPVFLLCSGLVPASQVYSSEKVTLQLNHEHQLRFAGFYSALWNETYSDAGLDVQIIPAKAESNPDQVIRNVLNGVFDFGVASIDLLKAYNEGRPIVAYATFFQSSDLTLYVRENTLVPTVEDLAKLRITIPPGSKYLYPVLFLLSQAQSDATHKGYSVSDTPLLDLKNGETDVIIGSSLTIPYMAERIDFPLKAISLQKYGLNLPGQTLFSGREFYLKHKKTADNFVVATRQGWQDALEHTDDLAIELTRQKISEHSTHATFGMSFFQADQLHNLAMYPVVTPGSISVDRWRKTHELFEPVISSKKSFEEDFVHDPVRELQHKARMLSTSLNIGIPLVLVLLLIGLWYRKVKRTIFRENEAELRRQATYDSLTELPNRVYAFRKLDEWIKQSRHNDDSFHLLFLDLDGFKAINDSLSHLAGDQLLVQVSKRLHSTIPSGAWLARLGGDEFLVLLETQQESEVRAVTDSILGALKTPFGVEGSEVLIGVSIGVACYPNHGENSQLLLSHADEAMYEAKGSGRNRSVVYTEELGHQAKEKVDIANQLRSAVERNEFHLCYQPITSATTGEVIGAEALLRWNNETLGMVTPDKFIPVAEETGSIVDIGSWVLDTALSDMERWNEMNQRSTYVSVNVSPRQFKESVFVENIIDRLSVRNISPKLLKIEVTESLFINDTMEVATLLEQLSKADIDIFLDDFGTGYSSLSYLKNFPIDVIKIDRGFINELTTDNRNKALVRAIVELARGLDMKVVSEGVENTDQLELLQRLSCDYIQGYFISKPLGYSDFTEFLKTRSKPQRELRTAS